jgi:hypothetical protein
MICRIWREFPGSPESILPRSEKFFRPVVLARDAEVIIIKSLGRKRPQMPKGMAATA